MGTTTAIEWADATVNTAMGCTKVSEGCKNCYMYRLMTRFGRDPDQPAPRKTTAIAKSIADLGPTSRVVFLNSMTDTFHDDYSHDLIDEWFDLLSRTPHKYLVLTKRINRAVEFFRAEGVPPNMWIGTSVESKRHYGRIAALNQIQTTRRFVSFEPLLESVADAPLYGVSWVIVGGESDSKAPRPFSDVWARELRDRCQQMAIPFFYKQHGGTRKIGGVWGGNHLDGRQCLQMPGELALSKPAIDPQTRLI